METGKAVFIGSFVSRQVRLCDEMITATLPRLALVQFYVWYRNFMEINSSERKSLTSMNKPLLHHTIW